MPLLLLLLALPPSQSLLRSDGPSVQRVVIETGSSPATARAGGALSLWVDVIPKAGIHVYAPGAKGFDPVTLVTTRSTVVAIERPKYPVGEPLLSPGAIERVPVYGHTFRIVQPVTVSKTVKGGQTVRISGAITYQACDDRLCYPTQSVPVSWAVVVR